MEDFLDSDFRQVWARHRITGEAIHLEVGQADAVREIARREWRCPVPGCDVLISTRGKSKRDHFFHLNSAPHPSDGESEAHLSAKAMVAAWAKTRASPGCAVREEETVKDPDRRLHRRADVMVTWVDGHKTAFEVEYKPFAVEDWGAKQADYAAHDIDCAWILGHTRVTPAMDPLPVPMAGIGAVKLPPLGHALAADGRHVLIVNPTSRLIGTCAGDSAFTTRVSNPYDPVWLRLDPLDSCDLDPRAGIVTPTTRAIDTAILQQQARHEAELRQAEEARRRMAEARQRRAQQEAAGEDRGLLPGDARAFVERKRAQEAARWLAHPLRAQIIAARPDHRLPEFLAAELPHDRGVYAHHEHWHCQLFTDLVLGPPGRPMLGKTVTMRTVYGMLNNAGFTLHKRSDVRGAAIAGFLDHLQDQGYLRLARIDDWIINEVTVIADLAHAPVKQQAIEQLSAEDAAKDAAAQRERVQAKARRAEKAERRHREREEAVQRAEAERAQPAHRRTEMAELREARHARWLTSPVREAVTYTHGGTVPPAITAPGLGAADVIDAAEAEWHAHLFMNHIHCRPPDSTFTLTDARTTLGEAGIGFTGGIDDVELAIYNYLFNLGQRGHLQRPNDRLGTAMTFTVIADVDGLERRDQEDISHTTPRLW
jgi:hypothetical protein